MGATGLAANPKDYRARLEEQTDDQIDAWAAELMRDIAIRRGVLRVIADFLRAASIDERGFERVFAAGGGPPAVIGRDRRGPAPRPGDHPACARAGHPLRDARWPDPAHRVPRRELRGSRLRLTRPLRRSGRRPTRPGPEAASSGPSGSSIRSPRSWRPSSRRPSPSRRGASRAPSPGSDWRCSGIQFAIGRPERPGRRASAMRTPNAPSRSRPASSRRRPPASWRASRSWRAWASRRASVSGPSAWRRSAPARGSSTTCGSRATPISWLPFAVGIPLLPLFAWLGASGTIPGAILVASAVAVPAGAALALANELPDIERDARAGLSSVGQVARSATYLGWSAPLLQGVVAVSAAAAFRALGGRGDLWPPCSRRSRSSAAASRWGPERPCRRRQRGWEVQAVAIGLLAAVWLAAVPRQG